MKFLPIVFVGFIAYLFYGGYFFCPGSILPTATTWLILIDGIMLWGCIRPPETISTSQVWLVYSMGMFLMIGFAIFVGYIFPAIGTAIHNAELSCVRANIW